jgi:transcriptional regulator with XRE-family HTH domain
LPEAQNLEVALESGTVEMVCVTRLNLAAIRRNRGLSLYDIARSTKISIRYLRAIEAEQFEQLPGLIYSVSYIKQYATAIDYDADVILLLFSQVSVHGSPQESSDSGWERYWRAVTQWPRADRVTSLSGAREWLLMQYEEIDRKFTLTGDKSDHPVIGDGKPGEI